MKKKSIIIISVSVALTLMIITSLFVTIFVINNRNKFTGTVFAQISDKVYSEYAHKIKKVYFAEGDTIKKGDLLFELDDTLIKESIRHAKKELEKAKSQYSDYINTESIDVKHANELSYKTVKNQYDQLVAAKQQTEREYKWQEERMLNELSSFENNKQEIELLFSKKEKEYYSALDSYIEKYGSYDSDIPVDLNQMQEHNQVTILLTEYRNLELEITNLSKSIQSIISQMQQAESTYQYNVKTVDTQISSIEEQVHLQKKYYDRAVNVTIPKTKASLEKEVEFAQEEYNNISLNLESTKIYAPCDGYIEKINTFENEHPQVNVPLCVISNKSQIMAEFAVTPDKLSDFHIGDEVIVEYIKEEYTAKITKIATVADDDHNIKVTALINSNDAKFISGVKATVTLKKD